MSAGHVRSEVLEINKKGMNHRAHTFVLCERKNDYLTLAFPLQGLRIKL